MVDFLSQLMQWPGLFLEVSSLLASGVNKLCAVVADEWTLRLWHFKHVHQFPAGSTKLALASWITLSSSGSIGVCARTAFC